MNRGYQTASKRYREQNHDGTRDATSPPSSTGGAGSGTPDLSSLLGSLGGAGRGGGVPDLSGILNNPTLMNMAQQFASSGALDGLMNDPRMREMAQSMMSGDRNIADMMNDPEVQNMYFVLGLR
jgi:small glutamine-rich tetratricopeptide repeat-containing protein alpha